jgi:ribosomal protein S12 methylthiotransferase accessory factor
MLNRPKKIKEILNLLSDYKRSQVIGIVETLHKMNLIKIEKEGSTKFKNFSIQSKYFPWVQPEVRDAHTISDLELTLIGDGLLASKLVTHLRNSKIKFNKIKSTQIVPKFSSKLSTEWALGKEKSSLEYSSSSFASQLNRLIERSTLLIVAADYPNINLFELINRLCFRKKKAWIRVSLDEDIGYLGPLVIPKRTSCFNCCELRLVTNSPDYEYELWRNKENIPTKKSDIHGIFADMLSVMCIKEIYRYLINSNQPDTIDNLLIFDTHHVNITKHHIISHPNCILCNPPSKTENSTIWNSAKNGTKSSDTRTAIEINKSDSLLSEEELLKRLRSMVDKKTGIVQEYEKLYEPHPLGIYFHHFSSATCSRPLRIGSNGQLTTPVLIENSLIAPSPSGSGLSATEAELHTLMESAERYSNMVLDESRLIWSSYNGLREIAINPVDLGLYSEEVYDRKDIKCSRFLVNSEMPWIEGVDLYSRKAIMVPADFVFYPAIRKNPLIFDTSNGASAHVDNVRAILNGLYEVIERDSFLTMWLNKISMPVLDSKILPFGFDESIKLINHYGMEVKLVDLTNDTTIPTIMAACHNKNPNRSPALLVGTGCHIDPAKALQKALFEMEFMLTEMLEHPNKKKINRPNQISTMLEHPLYYLNPNKSKYWEFMIHGAKKSTLQKLAKSSFKSNYDELMYIVRHLHGMNHRVLAVDITPSDIGKMGVKAVKVFVTGLQPLYVGNRLRLNLERLLTSAHQMNHHAIPNSRLEINLAPHPLP